MAVEYTGRSINPVEASERDAIEEVGTDID
jgi:hypothetical protein